MEPQRLAHDIGTLYRYPEFESRRVAWRNVDVWLPPGYDEQPERRYPVLYMHDGQNVFTPETSTLNVDWGADEALARLMAQDPAYAAIIAAPWSSQTRFQDYMPEKMIRRVTDDVKTRSDAYLRFLVEELKPFVDRTYRTLPDRAHTSVMGSSMGGLISLYAICEYPDVFRGAGCVSTHWPAGRQAALDYMQSALPDPASHRIYFDFGTETLDADYEPYQIEADKIMRQAGYVEGVNWLTRKFPGDEHSEIAWRARVELPLRFLLCG